MNSFDDSIPLNLFKDSILRKSLKESDWNSFNKLTTAKQLKNCLTVVKTKPQVFKFSLCPKDLCGKKRRNNGSSRMHPCAGLRQSTPCTLALISPSEIPTLSSLISKYCQENMMVELSIHRSVILEANQNSQKAKHHHKIVCVWKRDQGCKTSRDHAHIRTPWKDVCVSTYLCAREIYVKQGLPLPLATSTPYSATPPWR